MKQILLHQFLRLACLPIPPVRRISSEDVFATTKKDIVKTMLFIAIRKAKALSEMPHLHTPNHIIAQMLKNVN